MKSTSSRHDPSRHPLSPQARLFPPQLNPQTSHHPSAARSVTKTYDSATLAQWTWEWSGKFYRNLYLILDMRIKLVWDLGRYVDHIQYSVASHCDTLLAMGEKNWRLLAAGCTFQRSIVGGEEESVGGMLWGGCQMKLV